MRYLPHTEEEISSMLKVVGVKTLDDLFPTIPEDCKMEGDLKLPEPMTEWELNDHMDSLAGKMGSSSEYKVFVGAGSYNHFIPESINYLLGRSEFSTAYTPYQPEISQGTLQGIFEYQTLVARLLGMDIANASMYDGASALAEALLMAIRITRKKKVAVSKAIHPSYRKVVETYFHPTKYEIVEIPYLDNGRIDLSSITNVGDFAAIAVQSPNFFGVIEDLKAVKALTESEKKTMLVTCFSEPLAYGLYKNPGSLGADIVCGEGQSFGIPQSYGGPGLGMFACNNKFMRNAPGRLIGQTTDLEGKRAYVLTLATREQHIRREKATSNICSNQGLCAMTSAMYMASVGGTGIKKLAKVNFDKTEYFKSELKKKGIKIKFDTPTFNEFVAEFSEGFDKTHNKLKEENIIAGLKLEDYYPELKNNYLFCITETASKEDIDKLVQEVTK
ncbi:MAG: aminomethyl-transferring glycine dehydrogenase subunit GcvPA [Desulfobacterales bacterium]|nr:aminomethyl-transferring glycine dehydrogenase subunit GcvPA [Desulfobacterales bacterium]MCP4162726.1 aminomethyl-transferring glycine dehydrogenase subunit GcvPA [Deltaproteobacteria bacterium]